MNRTELVVPCRLRNPGDRHLERAPSFGGCRAHPPVADEKHWGVSKARVPPRCPPSRDAVPDKIWDAALRRKHQREGDLGGCTLLPGWRRCAHIPRWQRPRHIVVTDRL